MNRKEILFWLPLLAFLVFSLYRSVQNPVHDFGNYYFGSYFFNKGQLTPSIYEPLIFNQMVTAEGYHDLWISFAPNPPITALFFLPLTLFELSTAKLAFNLISCMLFVFSWWRLSRYLQLTPALTALLPLVMIVPLYNNISFGQVYMLLFFLLVEGFLAIERGSKILGVILWAIAILFKITPGIFVFYLLFKKEFRILGTLVLSCLVLFVISLAFNGPEIWKFYVTTILPKANNGDATAAAFSINYQSMFMFVKYLMISDSIDNPHPMINNPWLGWLIIVSIKITILAIASACTLKVKDNYKAWSIWIVAAFLISPYGNTYQYFLLLIPLLCFREHKYFIGLCFLAFLTTSIPIRFLYDLPLIFQFPRLYLVIILFILLTVPEKPDWNWKLTFLYSILFVGSELAGSSFTRDKSAYLINKETPPLLTGYATEDGFLTYTYWEDEMLKKMKSNVVANKLSSDNVNIRDNQIYYNDNPITSSPDKKLNAMVMNDTAIVYLSDKGRGYAFYTLRQISIK